jgi:hypothetical protein
MKTKSKCIGCHAIKLVNAMGLCKRCNRHAHDFISKKDIARLKKEREEMLTASMAAKLAKKEEEARKAEAEAEEKSEEEGEEGEEKEEGEAEAEESAEGKAEGEAEK